MSTNSMGRRLRSLRLKHNLTMKEVAQAVGVPLSTYTEWEYGRKIQGEPYIKLAKIFDVTLAELLSGESVRLKEIDQVIVNLENELESLKNHLRLLE